MFRGEMAAGDHTLVFGDVTYIMGVINTSPESNNLHTVATSPEEALDLALRYREWGADMVEVGGQSSHYDHVTLDPAQEEARVLPVVSALAGEGLIVAVDTWKPEVAAAAISAGASIVNDTGGLRDARMRKVVEGSPVGVVAVHVDGDNPHAVDEVSVGADRAAQIAQAFAGLLSQLPAAVASRLIVDPGIAINYRSDYAAYTRSQLEVIRRSGLLAPLGRPLLIPIPRKADIHWVAAYITMALEHDADLIRVHDVAVAAGLRRLWDREP